MVFVSLNSYVRQRWTILVDGEPTQFSVTSRGVWYVMALDIWLWEKNKCETYWIDAKKIEKGHFSRLDTCYIF